MNSVEFQKKLEELNACEEAVKWAAGKSWHEVYQQCERGDWLLWLFQKTNPNDLRKLTLAKAKCAETVIHLMKDERSKQAVRVAFSFGRGKASRKELDAAASAAYVAYAAAAAYADDAASAASAASAAYAASAATRKASLRKMANIVRSVIRIDDYNL